MITADVAYTAEHLSRCRSLTRRLPLGLVATVGMGFVGLLFVLSFTSPFWSFEQSAWWMLFLGLWVAFYFGLQHRVIARHPLRDATVRFGFDAEGVEIAAPEQSSRTRWSLVSRWQSSDEGLLFCIGQGAAPILVPRSALADGSGWDELINLFRVHAGSPASVRPGLVAPGFVRTLVLWICILVVMLLVFTLLR